MDDTETNPADAPRTPEPARGESDNTARLRPEGLQPEAAAQQQPAAAAAQQPAASAQPPAGTAYPYGAPQAPGANGGWQRPAGVPPYGWHPGQATYAGAPGAYPGRPGDAHQPQYATGQQSVPTWQPQGSTAQGVPGNDPPLPPWAVPVGQHPERPRRGRTFVAAGVAAVVLALGAGGAGAAIALAVNDGNGGGGSVATANSAVTRVVDRSSLAQIAEEVQPSVVSIRTGTGEGSGVILTADGYILSNNHVVSSAQGDTVQVAFADGKTATARIIGTDPRTDLAVVKAENVSGLKPLTFGSSATMRIGDSVLALGSPLGLEGSVTYGIISAKDRTIQSSEQGQPNNPFGQQQQSVTSISGLLQTDAAINPGNSGGALVNTNGELIGVNTAIATSGQSSGNIGVGFAIPSDKARTVADALMNGRKVSHPYLGVSLSESATATGAVIGNVSSGGPAAKAGLRQGDVIVKIGDKAVGDSDDVISAVQAGTVGQQVTVTYTRNGQQAQATVTLAEAP